MKGLIALARRHTVITFFVIAYTFSWAIWIPMALAGARAAQGQPWPNHLPGLFGPMVAAFIMSAVVAGRFGVLDLLKRMSQWRVATRWYVAALSPLGLFAVAAIALAASGRGWPDLAEMGKFSSMPVVAAPVMFVFLLVTAYAEETGWRGFAVPEMLRKRSLLTTAVVIGLLWVLWHVPSMFVIENYRQMGLAIVPTFTVGIVSGSILLAWMYRGSGGSVFIVALWHATYNLVSGTAAAHGLVAAIVSTAVMAWAAVIVVMEIRRWRRERRASGGLIPAVL
jgi:membrane protease YdiL (CAAX protease family)